MVRDSRKIAAILAADVVDYSRLMGADEAGTLAALAIRRAHLRHAGARVRRPRLRQRRRQPDGGVPERRERGRVRAGDPGRRRQRERRDCARQADAPAHRRQSRRRHRGQGRRGRRRGQRRRAAAGAREAGRRADLGHGLRPGAPQGPGALRRRRHAPRQEHRGAGADLRGAAGAAGRRRRASRAAFSRLHVAPRGARRRDRGGVRRRRCARPLLARHPGADDRPDARRGRAARIRRSAGLDRRAAIHQHDRRSRQRLPRRRPRGGADPPPQSAYRDCASPRAGPRSPTRARMSTCAASPTRSA